MSNAAVQNVFKLIEENEIKFVLLRFTNIQGKELGVSLPISAVDEDLFEEGKMFDGSSVEGWKAINKADMLLMPIAESAVVDPFAQIPTLSIRCSVYEPSTMQSYDRDPRSIAMRAETYLKSTGIADTVLFGPEPEFFLFDDVRFSNKMNGNSYAIDDIEGAWNTNRKYEEGNNAYRPLVKGGYCAVAPNDTGHDIRSEMCLLLEEMGLVIEAHHHEVATAGQNEIATQFNSLVLKADETQIYKYVVQNVALEHGKTACFMPKPLAGDNGSGMHCNMSLSKDGQNIFMGDKYAGLSETALYYIGGIIKHARALNAFTNPTTNSYKRLVPGFEAPVLLAYSAGNRSASIRIPAVTSPKATRIEARFPDPLANPYLAFSALLMAGLDGINNKIHPGDAMDKNLYDLPPEELKGIPAVAGSLGEALDALEQDYEFLTQGGVFSKTFIDTFIDIKRKEVERLNMTPHPLEFEMYY
ncbi:MULTISPECIES: type I glutamate--ammonia ligase [Pasteurellaceae]|uniref:Glutamine synthetase n=1 Tax=Pasteurella atlantica TaxID=2827233 RepID=A0AAW8CLM4_9PAST|nr:type I glutamate--ammonia ligase [Pasteurella atlantica]MBR0572923.1 type I glutamate--ammonia ligase [Pasteurella atlantica]MDP8038950.1 type I glutamate--ammonia ligase [Pasteurella atlantica]MDP8040941.1 type I glutamate--ammonia ligase [Pasteurella atlantica]MDP8043077.1 type I glutamate--ammonia ligase [Pasteurella atlantica]MDP8045163.1 type I glutamate--ammonia ligase [Pasteurella atlantica]